MPWAIGGLVEGFYGPPWSWDDRVALARWCADRGMTHYLSAPKDDPRHRERWRDPYPAEDLAGFERVASEGGLELGFAVSPGLSIDYADGDDRAALGAKIDQGLSAGASFACLALDDIPTRPGLGEDHAALTTWLRGELSGSEDLLLVPTEYTGLGATPYLEALATGLPDGVLVAWTGPTVVADELRVDQARRRADAVGRPPFIWDNYPVNDAVMADRLFLGPLRGRDPGLVDVCSGYLANPMVQPASSKLPLASIAAWLRGEDPEAAWAEEAEGWQVFADACDGTRPRELVRSFLDARDDASRAALASWLDEAATCEAPRAVADEAADWLSQARREARLGRMALALLDEAAGGRTGAELALLVALEWAQVQRSKVTVMGPRRSVRPVISQDRDGGWVFHREAVQADANAVDDLVRVALDEAGGGD